MVSHRRRRQRRLQSIVVGLHSSRMLDDRHLSVGQIVVGVGLGLLQRDQLLSLGRGDVDGVGLGHSDDAPADQVGLHIGLV